MRWDEKEGYIWKGKFAVNIDEQVLNVILKAALAEMTLSPFFTFEKGYENGSREGKRIENTDWAKSKFYDQKLRTLTMLPYDTEQWWIIE